MTPSKEFVARGRDERRWLQSTRSSSPAQKAAVLKLMGALDSPKASVKYGAARKLLDLSKSDPARLYPHFDFFARMLDHPKKIFQWQASLILAELVRVDSEGKFGALFSRYFRPILGPVMITAANVIKGAAVIARANPAMAGRVAAEIMKVRKADYATRECRNVVIGHALEALRSMSGFLPKQRMVLKFAQEQSTNPRPATARKAVRLVQTCTSLALALVSLVVPAIASGAAGPQWEYPPVFTDARVEQYKTVGASKLSLYIFDRAAPGTNRSAIVFFFGGGWQSGSPSQFEQQCRHYAARGMVAITADYRVGSRQGAKAADCVSDAKSCVRWIRQNATRLGIDPQKIVAAGGSAGGHIAAAAATLPGFEPPGEDLKVSSVPNALVLFNPALVLAPLEGMDSKGFETNLVKYQLGAPPADLSPCHHVKKGTPPTIILHGKSDSTVPFITVQAFAARMKSSGNRCELVGYDGQQHGFFNYGRSDNRYYDETLAAADVFLTSLGYLAPAAGTAGAVDAVKPAPNRAEPKE